MKILNDKEVMELISIMKNGGLDPVFLNYGGFIKPFNYLGYSKVDREEMKQYSSMYSIKIGASIYLLNDGKNTDYTVICSEKQATELNEVISKEVQSERYQNCFNSLFNAYTYEVTYISDDYMEKTKGDAWWFGENNFSKLPLNASAERDGNLLKEVEESIAEKYKSIGKAGLISIVGHYVSKRYLDVHFRNDEEYKELQDVVEKRRELGENIGPWFQIRRHLFDKKQANDWGMSEFVFRSTGRKILLGIHQYGTNIMEIDSAII